MSRLPIILVAVVLMLGGSWRVVATGLDVFAALLIGPGLVAFGAWLGLESRKDTPADDPIH